jgi:OFA family oxalate/formate antiporter-like MFS transporter
MRQRLVEALASRLPFFYGWVILGCVCAAGFSRQGPAVATLSIFIEPMTAEFGWSRTEISGAVSIGGILGALVSPLLGPFLDRNGARAVLCFAVLLTAIPLLLLSFTESLFVFYLLYCVARMNFAGPYDLGIYGSIVNWFVRRRTFVTSISTVALMSGLVAMPMIAHLVMQASGWRTAWLAVGVTVLLIGFLPTWLLHVRRPEDIGQHPDGERPAPRATAVAAGAPAHALEPAFTRRQAVATPAFWLLSLFTLLVYPVQSGISLHQAPFLIERGLDPAVAAGAVSTFALLSGIAGFTFGFWPRRLGLRAALALVGLAFGASCSLMLTVDDAPTAYAAAGLFGIGVGGLITTLPIAWADYFGRRSFGAIRGVALSVQVGAQAMGPVLSGVLRDATGSYNASLITFAVLGFTGLAAALVAAPPALKP